MIHYLILALIFLLSGPANRFRGGWLPTGHTQIARAVFALIMGIFCTLAFSSVLGLVTILAWGICEFLPNGDYLGAASVWQVLEATGVGIGNVLLPVVSIYFLNHRLAIPLLIAGASKGAVYYIANHKNSWWPLGKIQGWSKGAEMAEGMFGWALGAGIALSALI